MISSRINSIAALTGLLVCTAAGAAMAARPTPGSVTSERLKLPSGPSSVRGLADEPAVDPFFAQLSYQVPIDLPAGLGNLSPTLALAYSGALGNGPLGIGWTLAEPRIVRSTRRGVPRFDDTDTLEISGIGSGRLVAIGAGEYRVEGLGQTVRVRRVADGFEVDDGKGVHYRLGVTASTRQERDATHALAWRLEEETNQMGERIRYEYAHDRGQLYLTRIVWGPADAYAVTLTYEQRSDVTRSYREGFRVETARRLAAIDVVASGVARRGYQLAYDTTFPVARLAGVSSTGLAGSGAWPALSFTYAAPGPPVVTPVTGIGNWRLNTSGTTLVDLDGDGAAELLQLTSGGHSYLTNQNGTFGGLQPLAGNAQAIAAVQLQDLDGDGRAELVQDTGNGWAVYKFTRTQWVSQAATLPNGVWPGSPGLALKQPTTTRFADLNGDGLVDAMQWDNDNLKIHLATRTDLGAAYNVPRIGGVVLPSAQGRFQDVNGDGLDDYIVTGTDRLDVYTGHGDGTFEPAAAVAYPFSGTIASAEDIELADLDRDGLIDLLRIELGTVRWFRGRPDGTFTTTAVTLANPETLSAAVVVAVTDIDGNGSQDVVWSSTSGMWRMDLAGATTAGMLTRVQNGLGLDATFAYRSSHALAVEAAQGGSPWGSNVPIAIPVPVEKTTALGPGETARRVSYGVRDGFWDAVEQRFGGFLTTIVTTVAATPAETSSVITRYHAGTGAARELRGRPLTAQVKNGTGTRLSITTNTWDTVVVAGLPDVPLLRRAVLREQVTQYEDTTPARKHDVTYEYDALGRPVREVDNGRLDLTGDESVKTIQYAVEDDALWVRDQICEQKVMSLASEVVSDVQYSFGDDAVVQPLCVAGKGWPRETRGWLASEARFVTSERTSYDAHGNPVSITAHGVERRFVYDPSGRFPIEEHVIPAPGRELVWRATWDSVLGVSTAVTNPDGHTVHVSYDSLGRFTGAALDERAPHQIVEYDWTPPYPKTTTWSFDGELAAVGARPIPWAPDARWRQSVEVANGKGDVRYKALRLGTSQWIVSDYRERDPNARVVFAGRPVYTTQLELASRPAGIVGDQLFYDPLGRVLEQRPPSGASRTYSYTAFERTVQDANLAPVHSVLDGQGRPISTERSLTDGSHEIVQASYDAAGRLTQMRLAGGTVQRDFTYDTLGRLVQSHDPDLGTRSLGWDDGDRLVSELNAAGQTARYAYDALGRLVTRDTGPVYRFHYDDARPGSPGATNLG
ncbi:MAG: FG-GAP-like repeat-containing protein, partial [Kofleriaceae bacterium]